MKKVLLIFSILFLLLSLSDFAVAYYGRTSTEAVLSFEGSVEVHVKSTEEQARQAARAQAMYLMGFFQSEAFKKQFSANGVLGETFEVQLTGSREGRTKFRRLYDYHFEGKVVFHKNAFRNRSKVEIPIVLPLNLSEIYKLGVVRSKNRCTDLEFNDAVDQWYYWDPDRDDCPLKDNDTDVLRVTGNLKELENTKLTYPEYDKLYADNGNGQVTEVAIFIGYIDDLPSKKKPNRRDDAYQNFVRIEEDLQERGFQLVENKDAFRLYRDGREMPGSNFYRVYEKSITTLRKKVLVRVKMLVADTDLASTDVTFHHYLVPAFKNADVLIYDGHSGLGENLDPRKISGIQLSPDKYQIFFFNGCSTYPYYNGEFFRAKGGSASLEVVSTGLQTLAPLSASNVTAFMDRFVDGETVSYQRILAELDASNENTGSVLAGVNGDEDNYFQP